MSRTTVRAAVVCIAGVVALSTAACASEPPVAEPNGIRPPLVDPLVAYSQPPEVLSALVKAIDIRAAECMESFGFQYFPQDYESFEDNFVVSDSRLYGITDATVASVYGFMPAPVDGADDADLATMADPAYQLVLAGVTEGKNGGEVDFDLSPGKVGGKEIPPGGCLGAARLEITGDSSGQDTEAEDLANGLRIQAWKDAWRDSRTVDAKAEWAACMSTNGYQREDPVLDKTQISNGAGERAPEAEIREALADIQCKVDTDFVERANAVHVEHAELLLEANALALQDAKDHLQEVLDRANDIINQ